MNKASWTTGFAGLAVVSLGLITAIFAASHPTHSAFINVETALSKATTPLVHESNISNTGLAGSPNNDTINFAFSVKNAVTEPQANAIIDAYLNSARALDSKNHQFITPYRLKVEVYAGNLDGKLLFVGAKQPETMKIVWSRKS